MKKPNFFIIGAPKCGTTTLAAWLSEHPRVFMSKIKEPHYFDRDNALGVTDEQKYSSLFSGAQHNHIRVGEASVRYLHSRVAVQNILEYDSNAKFIAIVRNPIEMAVSLHRQFVFSQDESVADFELAWRLQDERRKGRSLPALCVLPQMLQYGEYCKVGEQLTRARALIPNSNLLVLFLEDLASNPKEAYHKVLDHLGLEKHDPSYRRHNPAKALRNVHLARFLKVMNRIKMRAGFRHINLRIGRLARGLNLKEGGKPVVPATLREELLSYFREDIDLLEDITGRNLDHWRTH